MYNFDNETAIAYGWMVLTIFVVVGGILIYAFYGVINAMIVGPEGDNTIGINHDIAAGKQSVQSKNAMQFNVSFATNVPVFVILGVLIFAVARALSVRRVP